MFQRVTGAYETLTNEHSRNELDIRLRAEALRAEAVRGYRQRREAHGAEAGGSYRYVPPSVNSILEDAVREANAAEGYVDNGFGEYVYMGDGGGDGHRGAAGSYGGYGGADDLRPPSHGWRWPARNSPWFEHDAE